MSGRPQALVTGASDRVGRAIAIELARAGFEVAVHFRSNAAGAEETVQACRAVGGEAWSVQADVALVEDCARLVAAVGARWDSLHVLVHNASTFEPVPFEAITLESWERMQAVHARGPFLISQGLLPLLRAATSCAVGAAAGEGGLVVHLCDIGADRPVQGYAHYSVSKAALLMLMKAMAVELAPAVRSVAISPGQVAWPPDYPEALRERISRRIPMGRVGTVDDVARLVRFVACEAPYLNGVVLGVDGGLSTRYG
jgi:pteridine reductase